MNRDRRLVLITFAMILSLFAVLETRVFYLQVLQRDELGERLNRYHFGTKTVPAPRGTIVDRNDLVLAASIPARNVEIWRPSISKTLSASLHDRLSPMFPVSEMEIRRPPKGGDGRPKKLVLAKSLIEVDKLWSLESLKEDRKLLGVDLIDGFVRRYPQRGVGGPLVGFVNWEGKGVYGIERRFENLLRGHDAEQGFQRDALGREFVRPTSDEEGPHAGADLVLTLDARIQAVAGQALETLLDEHDCDRAVAVVTDPESGEILAIAQAPSSDPEDRAGRDPSLWRNFAFEDYYAPGSSFKPFTLAMTMDKGLVDLTETIDCEGGRHRFGRRKAVRDVHRMSKVPLEDVIVHSSNIGIAKLFRRLATPRARKGDPCFEYPVRKLHELGFGNATDVKLPYETAGRVTPKEQWTRDYTMVSVAFGYEVGVTAVQMAQAFSVFPNGGVLQPLRLLKEVRLPDGRQLKPRQTSKRSRVFDEETVLPINAMLEQVVERGTAEAVQIEGVRVAGKTGSSIPTADRPNGTKTATFIGFAPVDEPEILVLVAAHKEGGKKKFHGGDVAAPAARRIMDGALSILGLK